MEEINKPRADDDSDIASAVLVYELYTSKEKKYNFIQLYILHYFQWLNAIYQAGFVLLLTNIPQV